MRKENMTLPAELLDVTVALANNLSTSEPFILYNLAKNKLNNDPEATSLLERVSQTQATLRKNQSKNQVTQEDIDLLRTFQKEAQENTIIMEYSQSQQKAIAFLREVNTEISQLIGIDFASLARRSSCC